MPRKFHQYMSNKPKKNRQPLALIVLFVFLICMTIRFDFHAMAASCGSTDLKLFASDAEEWDVFGTSIAISGTTMLVGAERDSSDRGSAYAFSEVSPGIWEEGQKLAAADLQQLNAFGHALDIEGTTMVITAHRHSGTAYAQGAAYIYTESSPGNWDEGQKLEGSDSVAEDMFGDSVGLSGSTLVIGTYVPSGYTGAAYVFSETSPGTWVEVKRIVGTDSVASDRFGGSCDISGTSLVVGASSFNSQQGAAYVFSEATTDNWLQVKKLVASDYVAGTVVDFGLDVSISGSTLVVGAHKTNDVGSNSGSVYVFAEVTPDNWVEVQKLIGSDTGSGDNFGHGVDMDGSMLVIGAHANSGKGVGGAYVYSEASPGNWIEVKKIIASDSAIDDTFAEVVAISGNFVACGRDDDSQFIYKAGAVYIISLLDECSSSPCSNLGTCQSLWYDFCCSCPVAYDGATCTNCLCENDGACEVGYCDCSAIHFAGGTCTDSCNNGVGGTYPSSDCNCTLAGATDTFCETDVDDCASNPCANGGACTDLGAALFPNHNNEFNCTCASGYFGDTCLDTLCYSSPCLNNGTCENGQDVVCNCTGTGYEGTICETEADECASAPCKHNGVCTDLLGTFSCNCTGTGWEGLTCNEDIDECLASPCENNGVCTNKNGKFLCDCTDTGYEGDICDINVDDCLLGTLACENDAVCTDDPKMPFAILCDCSTATGDYTGPFCELKKRNACKNHSPCLNGGVCSVNETTSAMQCDCAFTGYVGTLCDTFAYASECASSPCQNGGRCLDGPGQSDWWCECDGYTSYIGVLCDEAPSLCLSSPCLNAGTCVDLAKNTAYMCECASAFTGFDCADEAKIDPFLPEYNGTQYANETFEFSFTLVDGTDVLEFEQNITEYVFVALTLNYPETDPDQVFVHVEMYPDDASDAVEGSYIMTVTVIDTSGDLSTAEVVERLTEEGTKIDEYTNDFDENTRLQQAAPTSDERTEGEEDDSTVMIIIIVAVVVIAAIATALYMNNKSQKLKTTDTYSMPK